MASSQRSFEPFQLPDELPLNEEFRSLVKKLVAYKPEVVGAGILSIDNEILKTLSHVAFSLNRIFLPQEQFEGWHGILASLQPTDPEYPKILRLITNAHQSKINGYPTCQDTGTDVVQVNGGNGVVFEDGLSVALQSGADGARDSCPYRSSVLHVLESGGKCTKCVEEKIADFNGPTEIHHLSVSDTTLLGRDEVILTFSNKGGGSGSKFVTFSESPALLNDEERLDEFLREKIIALGHSACPPYGLEVVLGGTSEQMVTSVKASISRGDGGLYTEDSRLKIVNDPVLEQSIQNAFAKSEMGAQGPGRNFLMPNGVQVYRLPRHGATAFISIGVNCSATRNYRFKITPEGIFHVPLEHHPERYLANSEAGEFAAPPQELEQHIDLGTESALEKLREVKFGHSVRVSGEILVARDKAHERWKKYFEENGEFPPYLSKYLAVMYAGPADAKDGDVIGSVGPTTALRMDRYADLLLSNGLLPLSIAKGSRTAGFREACGKYGGMYAVLQGGVANELRQYITARKELDYGELGMEAVQVLTVQNMPIEMIIDSRGKDTYAELNDSVPAFRTTALREEFPEPADC